MSSVFCVLKHIVVVFPVCTWLSLLAEPFTVSYEEQLHFDYHDVCFLSPCVCIFTLSNCATYSGTPCCKLADGIRTFVCYGNLLYMSSVEYGYKMASQTRLSITVTSGARK